MENTEPTNKNNSSYRELLDNLRRVGEKAIDLIPPMCDQLGKENPTWDHEQITERVKRDGVSAGFSVDYIIKLIPKKYKDQLKIIAGQKGAQTTNVILGGGGSEIVTTKSDGIVRQDSDQNDVIRLGKRVEELLTRVKELEEQLDLKKEMLRTTDNSDVKELQDRLESAEMEIGFLKEGKNGEELIRLKGKNADDRRQFYYGRIGHIILKRKLDELSASGIKVFEIYLEVIK